MHSATPSSFTILPPQLIPAMLSVRSQTGTPMSAALADYALRAATLGHLEAAAALQSLCERLPDHDLTAAAKPAPAMPAVANVVVADDVAHDQYFNVCRVSGSAGTEFLRSILMAARLFHADMASVYGPLDAQRFAAVGSGFA